MKLKTIGGVCQLDKENRRYNAQIKIPSLAKEIRKNICILGVHSRDYCMSFEVSI